FRDIEDHRLQEWLRLLRAFLLRVSIATARPLVIKSPTHTGRIGELVKQFPQAKFIHLTRDPRALFPSTCRLWQSLDRVQGFQVASAAAQNSNRVEEYVIECLRRMYDSFHAERDAIDDHHLIDVRYEDLVSDPVRVLEMIYESLRLADFDTVRESLQHWVDSEHQSYQANQHELDPVVEERLRAAWSTYFERYGYA
ncbi:MAG: sulfotransferase, partial [Planctomycetota bacterium]